MINYKRFMLQLVCMLAGAIFAGLVLSAIVLAIRSEASTKKTNMDDAITAGQIAVETETAKPVPEFPEAYTAEDLELLALVIYQEAGGDNCSDITRQMVGEVVLNRVADSRYPNNLHDVLIQKAQYGRLYWTGIKWPERAGLPQEAHAVARAYDTAKELLDGTARLLPENTVFQAEFEQGTETVAWIDGLYFCK